MGDFVRQEPALPNTNSSDGCNIYAQKGPQCTYIYGYIYVYAYVYVYVPATIWYHAGPIWTTLNIVIVLDRKISL